MIKRSLFGVVRIYKQLSQDTVNNENLKIPQKPFQDIVKTAIEDHPKWDPILHKEI